MLALRKSATLFNDPNFVDTHYSNPTPASNNAAHLKWKAHTHTNFKFQYPKRIQNSNSQGKVFRSINGIKCFIKYIYDGKDCDITVYSKIYSKPLCYTFKNCEPNFNPKAELKKIRIKFDTKREPYITAYKNMDETLVDQFSDTLFYMVP